MTIEELNNFIKHYIEKDKTQSAIMLSAPWGTGKSYYIHNNLIPFLDKNDSQKKCIIVSLYGLKDVKDISKSIFLESKVKVLNKRNTGLATGKLIGKTIVKGVASFFGVDLSVSEDDLINLYKSIDLSDKLIVLEDIERSEISIIEVLGYVNNLVEQDGVKVLLVANEKEILKYEEKAIENNGDHESKTKKVLTVESQLYLRTKEKTISDTILFYSSNIEAMTSIIEKFENKYLNTFLEDYNILKIIENKIMSNSNIKSYNLRSFIFACQKTIDFFEKIDFDVDKDFLKNIFLGIVAFSLKNKEKENLKWESNDSLSFDLGTYEYPCYKFAYDFICEQYFDKELIKTTNEDFISHKTFLENEKILKPHLQNIYNYYICSEEEVLDSVKFIVNVFETEPKRIPISEYGGLANHLIAIKQDLGYDDLVETCKKIMLKNLIEEVDIITKDQIMFHNQIKLETQEAIDEFYQFKKEIEEKLSKNDSALFNFDYSIQNLQKFCIEVESKSGTFVSKRCFAQKLDTDKFIELLKKCNAKQIQQLRGMFQLVYSFSNIDEFFSGDKETLVILKNKIEILIKTYKLFDRIQLKQINYLISNLGEFIERL